MAVALSPEETVTVLRLSGDLSLRDMEGLSSVLTELSVKGKVRVILNFRQVNHVALSGISKLAERNFRLRSLGGKSSWSPWSLMLPTFSNWWEPSDISTWFPTKTWPWPGSKLNSNSRITAETNDTYSNANTRMSRRKK